MKIINNKELLKEYKKLDKYIVSMNLSNMEVITLLQFCLTAQQMNMNLEITSGSEEDEDN